jgi:GNAT superfamily N-acetyltransferase
MGLDEMQRMARAVEDNWSAAWATLGSLPDSPQTYVDDTPGFVRVYTPGAPEMLLNLLMRYTSSAPVEPDDIERAIVPYRAHRLPFQWWLTLGMEPAGLRQSLRAIGMQNAWGGAASMSLALEGWNPQYRPAAPEVLLSRVATPEDERDALRVICEVFFVPSAPMARWTIHNPAFDVYCARLNGRMVAALATLRRAEVVGVYHVATLPGARRRGIAGNLLLLALRAAQRAGCTLATLTATPEARHLYETLGFRTCGTIEQWIPGSELTYNLMHGRLLPGTSGRFGGSPTEDRDC